MTESERKQTPVVASDGKLMGLYFIVRYCGDWWPIQIVGQFDKNYVCRTIEGEACSLIETDFIHKSIRADTEIFASEAACWSYFEQYCQPNSEAAE